MNSELKPRSLSMEKIIELRTDHICGPAPCPCPVPCGGKSKSPFVQLYDAEESPNIVRTVCTAFCTAPNIVWTHEAGIPT